MGMIKKGYIYKNIKKWTAVVSMAGILLCGTGCSDASKKEEETAKVTPFPEFSATDLEGNTIDNEFFENKKLTMVNVWGTFCSSCIQEMPALGELAEENEENFQILGIISDIVQTEQGVQGASVEEAKRLVELTGAEYTHIVPSEDLYLNFVSGISAVPTTFFVNEKGEIMGYGISGAKSKEGWQDIIDRMWEQMDE